MRARMMMGTALALALVAMPAMAQGGQGRAAEIGRGMMQDGPGARARNPAAAVLEHRAELDLTADQVRQLEAIQARVQQENAPRLEQLKAAFGDKAPAQMTPEERQALRDRMLELRPVREEIRATNRKAGEEIHALLTDEQEAELRPLMHAGWRDGRPGRGRVPRGVRRGPPGGGL